MTERVERKRKAFFLPFAGMLCAAIAFIVVVAYAGGGMIERGWIRMEGLSAGKWRMLVFLGVLLGIGFQLAWMPLALSLARRRRGRSQASKALSVQGLLGFPRFLMISTCYVAGSMLLVATAYALLPKEQKSAVHDILERSYQSCVGTLRGVGLGPSSPAESP